MNKLKLLTLTLSLLLSAGIVFGQAQKSATQKAKVQKQMEQKTTKQIYMLPANMDPNFVPKPITSNPVLSNLSKAAITSYGWNAYGGTTAVGAVTIDLPAGTMTSIAGSSEDFIAGADWANGVWYGVQYNSAGGSAPLVTLDPATGAITSIGGGIANLTGLAFDINTSIMYTMDFAGNLYTISLTDGTTTLIGASGLVSCIGLAADNAGVIYAIDLDDNLYTINKTTGASTLVGPLGFNIAYAQDIAYDRDNDVLYGALYVSSGGLYTISTTTGAATLVVDWVSEVDGFAIPYTPVEDDAPGAVTSFVVTPAALGALTANAGWNNPALTYAGAALTELTSVKLFVDGAATPAYENNTPVIGGPLTYTYTAAAPGFYDFSVFGSNSAGDGEATLITVWIGEDVPSAPTAATLVDGGAMLAQVSWTAPTTGMHGAYFSGTGVTYDVTRYPGAVLVSDNQTGLSFQETLINAGNYYYTITASNPSGVGGTATTNSELFGNFYIYEDFEGTFPSASWTTASNVGIWAQSTTGTIHPSGFPAHSGSNLAYFNSWTCATGSTADLITPSVDLSAGAGLLSIWVFHEPGYATSNDIIQIKMSIDDGANWTNLGAPISRYGAVAGWVEHTFIVTGGTTTTKFNFFATSAYGNDIHIDDITLVDAPSCLAVNVLSATGFTLTGATLNWTLNGTETAWNVEYGVAGFTLGTGTAVAVTTNPTTTLTSLTSNTAYDFYVQADCGGGDQSSWAGPYTFNTLCDVVTAFPWFDGFETGIGCYSQTTLGNGPTWYWDEAALDPYEGVSNVTIEYDDTPDDQDEWFISPEFNFSTLASASISFAWNMSFAWGVSPDDNYDMTLEVTTDGTTWTPIWTEPAVFEDWTWYDTTLDVSAYAGANFFKFAFHYVGNDGAAFYVDSISIDGLVSATIIENKALSVYPNPTTGIINVSEVVSDIELYDVLGNLLMKEADARTLNIRNLANGLYILKVTNDNDTRSFRINLNK